MFGGGNGSFGVAQPPNPFGAAAQASPVNPFQGGGGFGGASGGRGGYDSGSAASGTAFGGRGGSGGRSSFSSRGGRSAGRGRGGYSGGRGAPSFQGNTYESPNASFGGGRGRGAGPAAAADGFDNPFASPAPSAGGFGSTPSSATAFGQPGRGGGRAGGREGGGRGTTFGGGLMVQPNIRRKSEVGGRGPRSAGTSFGQPGVDGFVPPLPPSSPPPPGFSRKPGRGGIVTPLASPAMSPATTAFGQQAGGPSKYESAPAGFPRDAGSFVDNPFAAATSDSSTRTAFGAPSSSSGAFSEPKPRLAREKRQSNTFVQQQGFQDEFHAPSAFEARLTGGRGGRGQNSHQFQLEEDRADPVTTFGRDTRKKTALNNFPCLGVEDLQNGSGVVPAMKSKKKMARGTPQQSPPRTPGTPSEAPSGYQTIGDQKNKAVLSSAKNLDGTCVDMCSPTERELHIRVDELSLFEKCFPGKPGQERELIVKRFQRSSADHKLDIPSELRPLGVLRQTQLYLEQQIMDRERLGPDPRFATPRVPELIELYNFCWDRCRMLRKDFVLQNYRGAGGRVHPIAVDVHERIARYHILSEHELCEVPSFVAQQNMEQLGQTLKSLSELYDESRKLGDPAYLSPFEAEFRGYFILCTLDNGRGSDVLKFVKGLAPQIREAPQVKFAMQVFVARHTQNYYLFFKLFREATYLQSCLVFRYIPSMRSLALERLNRANRNQPYPLSDIAGLLCFDDLEHVASVCSQHGLDISASEEPDREGEPVVNFGGEFETDIQLRQNKNPLPVHASHVYVSQKQGDFLRGEVCRGVTEYNQPEYPALSKLIEDTEIQERLALYPDRLVPEDQFSEFAVYTSDPYDSADESRTTHSQDHSQARGPVVEHSRTTSFAESDERLPELDELAKRKAEVERTKIMMMQRIQQLEREKEEKKQKAQQTEDEKKAAQREAEEVNVRAEADALRKLRDAEAKRREEEESHRKQQMELELEAQRQREAERAAADQARLADARRVAEEKRRADEEQKRIERQRIEEEQRRQAAIEAERRRQAELAAERERLQREAERKAELARETARRKALLRIQKQRLAVLRLRFYKWKKSTTQSKALPRSVNIGISTLVDQCAEKPADVMDWLFGGPRSASDFIGLVRRREDEGLYKEMGNRPLPDNFWRPLDVASIAGLASGESGHRVSGWKFVVADLLDEGLSSFGSWCAVKCGISSATLGEEERISTLHATQWSGAFGLAVCCRYMDANFLRSLSPLGRQKKLAGTSAILLPLDLTQALDATKLKRWEERVRGILTHLHPTRQVGVVVLGFCSSGAPRKGDALAAAEASIGRIRQDFEQNLSFIDGELVLEEDLASAQRVDSKISAVLAQLAGIDARPAARRVMDLSELVESVVDSSLQENSHVIEGVEDIQSRLHRNLWKLRDVLLSPATIDVDIPVPELQATLGAPIFGWNSRESQQKWDGAFKALTSQRITAENASLSSSKLCEVFFAQISRLVDGLFAGYAASVSTDELKRSLYDLLVPIHNEFLKSGELLNQDPSRLLPWRQIFGQIYGAFVGSLGEELVYVPYQVVEEFKSRAENPNPLEAVNLRRSRHRLMLNQEAQAAAVAFARRELKRALSEQAVPPAQSSGIKKLRQEIVRDRAASQSYQQFLRREMAKWATFDDTITMG